MGQPTDSFDAKNAVSQARQLHHAGKFADAERLYRKVLSAEPMNSTAMQLLGTLLCQTSRPRPGLEMLENAVRTDAGNAEAWLNLAVARHLQSDTEGAREALENSVRVDPLNVEAQAKLGYILIELGRNGDAEIPLGHALQLNPNYVEAHLSLGDVHRNLGRVDEAEKSYREAIRLQSTNSEALNNLGTILLSTGRLDEAIQVFKRAAQLRQRDPVVLTNLAHALEMRGLRSEAKVVLQHVLKIAPNDARAKLELATILRGEEKTEESLALVQQVLRQDPSRTDAAIVAARLLEYLGECDAGREMLEPLMNSPAARAASSIMLPVIPKDEEEIAKSRTRFKSELEALVEDGVRLDDPLTEVGLSGFFLAYHRDPELDLQRSLAGFYRSATPSLSYTAPHVESKQVGERIRLGVVSAMLNNHTIGKLFAGLVERLDPRRFEVLFFDAGRFDDSVALSLSSRVEKRVLLSPNLAAARAQIASHECDAIFYPELGMSPLCYFLAFSRLARRQFLTWGHPSSPGINTLDAFISSELLESDGAESHYEEELIKLPDLGIFFKRPELPQRFPTRTDLGLPEDKHLYVCPQTLFKLHPDFDRSVAEILRQDTDGLYVLTRGKVRAWSELNEARFKEQYPDVADRLHWVEQQPLDGFLGLCRTADAILDPFYFGGGNSSLEMFAVGAPVVTLPGWHLRGRITLALYKKMDMPDLVAADEESFIELALRLARDQEFQHAMREKTLERCPVLYEDDAPVRQFESAVENLVRLS